jgi:molybdate transport system ATP-binding protein
MLLETDIRKTLAHFTLDIQFSCPAGELLALVGPSGSGKTTVIRILAGLESPDSGTIRLGPKILYESKRKIRLETRKRKLGYVFQEASLFPHLRIYENVAFGCDTPSQVSPLLELLGIAHLGNKKPAHISGGERQRAALAQALAAEPDLLLLDEPFSALDIKTRHSLQQKFLEIKNQLQIPIILVTHDLQEAAVLSDQILPMEDGKRNDEWLNRFQGIVLPKNNGGVEQTCSEVSQGLVNNRGSAPSLLPIPTDKLMATQ